MTKTAKLFTIAEMENIRIEWRWFAGRMRGIYINGPELLHPVIGLDRRLENYEQELRCTLAHELGHHFRSSGQRMVAADYASKVTIDRAEREADDWALDTLLPSRDFIEKLTSGMTVLELADYFWVTEEFVQKKLNQLKRRGYQRLINTTEGMFIAYQL